MSLDYNPLAHSGPVMRNNPAGSTPCGRHNPHATPWMWLVWRNNPFGDTPSDTFNPYDTDLPHSTDAL